MLSFFTHKIVCIFKWRSSRNFKHETRQQWTDAAEETDDAIWSLFKYKFKDSPQKWINTKWTFKNIRVFFLNQIKAEIGGPMWKPKLKSKIKV